MSDKKHPRKEIKDITNEQPITETNEAADNMDMADIPMDVDIDNHEMFQLEMPMQSEPDIPMQEMPISPYQMMNNQMPENQVSDVNMPQMPSMEMDEMQMNMDDLDIDIENMNSMRGIYDDINQYVNYYDYRVYGDVNDILRRIERRNPGIIRRLLYFGVPYEIARDIVRRIIRLTLDYYR